MFSWYDDFTMVLVKKLIFAPLFLLLLGLLFYFISPLLKTTDLIFSLNLQTVYQLIILSILIITTALMFVIFASLALDWKLVVPISILSALMPLLFTPIDLGIVFGIGIIISLGLTYLSLENKMKSYITFQGPALLSPSIKQLTVLLILSLSLGYYLSINNQIAKKGFEIPDSLIDNTLKIMPQTNLPTTQLPQIPPEQLDLLKKNPELLKQYNIDPKMLDNLPTSSAKSSSKTLSNPGVELIKPMIKEQLQNIIKPYQTIIPAVLALFLFLTLQTFVSVLEIFLSPVIWLIFNILERTGFVKFESEMREVKKLIV